MTRAAPKRGGGRPVATLAHVVADLARVTAGERPAWCAETTWQTLRNAVMAEQWPLDQKDRRAMFTKLRDEHAASTDRVGFITNAFKAVDPDAESFLKAESKGSDEL